MKKLFLIEIKRFYLLESGEKHFSKLLNAFLFYCVSQHVVDCFRLLSPAQIFHRCLVYFAWLPLCKRSEDSYKQGS